ncbi:MAG: hypothetical protein FD180_3947 [Planctomycetota bacterium]|nr:MAG: hypothetical protein FD180_3947 [Planctomycetota bacterium]
MRKVLTAAVLLLFPVLLLAQEPPAPPTQKEADTRVTALKEACKGESDEAKKQAIAACADCPHPSVAAALAPLLASGADELRIAVAQTLGRMAGFADAAKALHGGLKPNEKQDKVLRAVFEGIAKVGHAASVGVLEKWIDDRLDLRDSEEVPGVILAFDVLGFLKFKTSVDVILELCNKKKVSGEGAGTGGRYKLKCGQHAEAALVRLTGQEAFGDVELWKDWWKKHARDYKDDLSPRDAK